MKRSLVNACDSRDHKALAYRNEALIERLMEKLGLDREKATLLMKDMLKFLVIAGTSPTNESFGPPHQIDEAWHHFILFTEDYALFCYRYFGKFLHHRPTSSSGQSEGKGSLRKTYQKAFEAFGDLSDNWGKIDGPSSCLTDCEQCGGSTNCQNAFNERVAHTPQKYMGCLVPIFAPNARKPSWENWNRSDI